MLFAVDFDDVAFDFVKTGRIRRIIDAFKTVLLYGRSNRKPYASDAESKFIVFGSVVSVRFFGARRNVRNSGVWCIAVEIVLWRNSCLS